MVIWPTNVQTELLRPLQRPRRIRQKFDHFTGVKEMRRAVNVFILVSMLALGGCQSVYYKTMETFGYHKREILVDRVEDGRDAQQEAKEQFESALEKFSAVVDFRGGELEEKYEELKVELENSESKAKAVRKGIGNIEDVAEALFEEWESELGQYSNDKLRRASEQKLDETRQRYSRLIGAMKRAEAKIQPVLSAFRDQVLFLKPSVEADIASLIKEMEASIAEADAFIQAMSKE
jgi:hypothetical protein